MEIKVEKLPKNKVKLKIAILPEEMIKHFKRAYDQLAPSVSLQGFRPGKAPRAMVESTLGVSRLLSEALDSAINEGYIEALKQNDLNPVASPNVVINQYPEYGQTAAEIKNNLEYEMEVEVFPGVEFGDIKGLKVDPPKKETVLDADVEKVITNLLKQKSTFKEVDRAAKMGDFAEVTFEGFMKKVRIDAMCSKNHPVVLGDKSLIPGFEEEIVGMKKGDTKEFKIKFPKDYHAKDYAGKEAEFKLTLIELKEVVLPELDEAFVSAFGQKDEKSLRDAIKENLGKEMEQRYQDDLEIRVIDKALTKLKADVPESMIKRETDRLIENYKHQLEHMGVNLASYLDSIKKSEDDLRKDMRPAAEKNVKVGLMLGEIVKSQKLDPEDQESGKKAIEYLVKELVK
ncbi:MAG: trigger factor [Candidatus Berkelbacteria bacterium]|nr:trigger factor [Candidatus Berkelbacteria bacterium]